MSRSSSLLLDALGFRAPEVSQQTADSLLREQGLELFTRNAPVVLSPQEKEQQAKDTDLLQAGDPTVGLWTAASVGLPSSYLIRSIQRANTPVVPGYSVNEDELKRAVGFGDNRYGLDPRYWAKLLEATSPDDLQVLREQAYSMQIAERKLASSGADGMIVQFAAGFADPLSLAAFTGAGEVASIMGATRLAGRVGAAARNGLIAGTAMGPINLYIASQDPNMTARDVIYSTLEMMGAGALLGTAFHGKRAEAGRLAHLDAIEKRRAAKALQYQDLKDASGGKTPDLTESGKVHFAENIQDDLDLKAIDDHVDTVLRTQAEEDAKTLRDFAGLPKEPTPPTETQAVPSTPTDFITHDTMKPGDQITLYRGEGAGLMGESVKGGDWWTSNKAKAEQYGSTRAITIDARELAKISARGDSGNDVWVVQGGEKKLLESGGKAPEQAPSAMGAASPDTINNPQFPPRGNRTPDDPDYSDVSNARGFTIDMLKPMTKIPLVGRLFRGFSEGIGKTSILVQSKNPVARQLGRTLADEGLLSKPGEKSPYPASMRADRNARILVQKAEDETRGHFETWAGDRKGMNWTNRAKYEDEFFVEVTKARRDPTAEAHPSVTAAAKVFTNLYENARMRGARNGLPGFWEKNAEGVWKELPANPRYANRVYAKLREYIVKLGNDGDTPKLQGFLERALEDNGSGTLTPRLRTAMAKAVLRLAEDQRYTDIEMARMFSGDQAEMLRSAMIDAGIDESTIADVMHAVKQPEPGKGGMKESKRRIDFDETYTEAIIDKDGNEIAVSFQDLLENNAMVLWSRYARHLEGHIPMQEIFRVHSPVDGQPIRTVSGLLSKLERDGKAFGQTAAEIAADAKRVKSLANYVLAIPQDGGVGPETAAFLQDMRIIQYMRLFGMSAFSYLANFGSAAAGTSVETWAKVAPRIGSIIADLRMGKTISEPLARQLRAVAVLRSERQFGNAVGLLSRDKTTETFYSKIRNGLRRGAKVFGNVTGILPMIHAQQEIFAIMATEEWATVARSGKLPSKARLHEMGLSEDDGRKIIAAMRQHTKTRDTDMGGPIHELNINKWDPEARTLFADSIDKITRKWVLDNDPGHDPLWIDHEFGKTMIQGRRDMLTALNTRVRSAVQMRDMQAAFAFSLEASIGMGAYALREQVASVGRKDRDEYLKDRLSTANLVKAAIARNSFTQIFAIPTDAIADATGFYPSQFSHARSTGLGQWDFPTFQFARGVMGPIPKSMIAAIHPGRKFTQADMRNLRMLIPFQNALIVKNGLDYLESRLPKYKDQP